VLYSQGWALRRQAVKSGETEVTFPTFESSDFSGENDFYFDLVRMDDRQDIPRGFPHRHSYYHLLWMTEARGTHKVDFETFEVLPRSVFFISPGQLHAWTSTIQPQGFVLNVSAEFFTHMFPHADDIAKFPFFHINGGTPAIYLTQEQHAELLPLVEHIEHEYLDHKVGRFDIVRSYLLILLTHLRRLYPIDKGISRSDPNYSLARRFTLLIEERYLEYTTIRQYADAVNLSERQLNEVLKATLGHTASRLIQERVALEAKRLLSNTTLSTAEIAFQLNFDDPAYFTRFFKKITDHTPGFFRQKYTRPLD
jgi:AraC family transcriptional activator of pobA